MNFQESITIGFVKWKDFNGRASRSEYWWFFLFYVISTVLLQLLAKALNIEMLIYISLLYSIVLLWCLIAVSARRLHDLNKSAWWLLLLFGLSTLMGITQSVEHSTGVKSPISTLIDLAVLISLLYMAKSGDVASNRFGAPRVK